MTGEDGSAIHEFCIRGLHCSDCVRTVEAGLEGKKGVDRAEVNLASGRVCVMYDPSSTGPAAIEREVRRMGYAVGGERDGDGHTVLWSGEFVAAVLSGVLLFLGLAAEHALPHWQVLVAAGISVQVHHLVYLASMVFGGAFILRRAVASLMTLTFTADGLMIIAAIGATALGAMAEGAAVLFLYSVAEILEDWAAERNRSSLRALVELAPQRVSVLRDGGEVDIAAEEVEIGDVAIVRPGDRMPVDGVVKGGSTSVNEATITGEAAPVSKVVGSPVYAGTLNVDGAIEVRVSQRAHNTALNRIISMVEEAEERRAPVERFIDRFARWYTPAVLLGAVLVATVPTLALGADGDTWVYRALMLLVIACPCALAISVPVAVVSAISTSARQGILFKGGAYLEQLSEVDVVAFDKTGTLTTGEPRLADVRPSEGWARGSVLAIAAGVETGSEHHLARAVMRGARHEGVEPLPTSGFKATPGKGIRADRTDSGLEVSLGNPGWAQERGLEVDEGAVEAMAAGGRTVVVVAQGDEVVGLLAFSDTPRRGARESVAALQGVRTMLLSGDSRAAAKGIAELVGITEVYAPLLPEEKVEIIGLLRADGHRVAMVGDGVNDAPSLAEADVGIAMGAMGSDVAMETADVVLLRDDVGLVPAARHLSVRAMRVIRQNVALAISIKVAIATLVFVGLATLWMAVAIGDMGASLVVILNALRLGVRSGDGHGHATSTGGTPPAVAEAA